MYDARAYLREDVRGGRILVIHQGALGDFILTLPAIAAIKETLDPKWLELMGQPWVLSLADCPQYADRICDINKADMAFFFVEDAPLPERLIKYFEGFDAAFVFLGSRIFYGNLLRAGVKRVFQLAPFPVTRIHVTDHHLRSLSDIGIFTSVSEPGIFLREEEKNWAQELVFSNGWRDKDIIAIHPGAGGSKKVWPRFSDLGRILAGKSQTLLIVQGPADDKTVRETLDGLCGISPYIIHDLPVTRLAALLSHAGLFIGNDSGVTHLAAALGLPTVAIFGPTDPMVWGPRGRQAFWLMAETGCSPCDREIQRACRRQRCLENISVEDVLALIEKI